MFRFRGFTRKNKTGIVFAAILFFCILLLIFTGKKIHFKPKEVGLSVVSVFQHGFSEIGDFFARTVRSVNEVKKLRAEYSNLQAQLDTYKTLERDLVELREENERLRSQLEFSERVALSHEPAEIIARDPSNLFNTIVINKGKKHGVGRNMPVIAYQDGFHGLIGKTVNVGITTSEVLPLFDKSCNVAGRLQDSRYEGLIMGNGEPRNLLTMKYLQKSARSEVTYGDLVVTSGMSSIYPKGIYVGRVRSIQAKEYESSLEMSVEPIIDFSKLEYVFVLKTEK
jgi:rod shape-determining protein MreC